MLRRTTADVPKLEYRFEFFYDAAQRPPGPAATPN
jgi:hypothetical protein